MVSRLPCNTLETLVSLEVPHSQLHQYFLSLVKSKSISIILKVKQAISSISHGANPLVTETFLHLAAKLKATKIHQALLNLHFKLTALHTHVSVSHHDF